MFHGYEVKAVSFKLPLYTLCLDLFLLFHKLTRLAALFGYEILYLLWRPCLLLYSGRVDKPMPNIRRPTAEKEAGGKQTKATT